METTTLYRVIYWVYIGMVEKIMEKSMEATTVYWS